MVSDPEPFDIFSDPGFAAHPHDGFFKAVFSDPDKAGALFRAHLPEELTRGIEWNSLALLPSSFVKRDLRQTHSDLLFSARLHGRETLLYLVFEHQSTPDPLMPLSLLGYMVEIMLAHTRDRSLPLPPVVGFVLHQGPEPWSGSTAFEHLFDLPPAIAEPLLPYLPKFYHALLDLSTGDSADREGRADLRMILHLMKCAREQRLLEFFAWLAAEYATLKQSLTGALLRLALWYALHADKSLDVKGIYQQLQSEPELRQKTMTTAEHLIAIGKAEGKAEGMAQGEWIGRLHVLEELMNEPATPKETLHALTPEELEIRFRECQRRYDERFKR